MHPTIGSLKLVLILMINVWQFDFTEIPVNQLFIQTCQILLKHTFQRTFVCSCFYRRSMLRQGFWAKSMFDTGSLKSFILPVLNCGYHILHTYLLYICFVVYFFPACHMIFSCTKYFVLPYSTDAVLTLHNWKLRHFAGNDGFILQGIFFSLMIC